jgi:chromosome segregation ATPase
LDTDTIREKFIRSEEALTRIRDDISQLIFSRLEDFKNTEDYLETLIREKDAVDTQISDQEAKISSIKESITTNKKSSDNLKQKQANIINEVQHKELNLRESEREYQTIIQNVSSLKTDIDQIKLNVDNAKNELRSYQEKIHSLETEKKQKIEEKEQDLAILRRDFSQIQINNSILSFLLDESAEDIPEVDILAELMNKSRVSQDQLKHLLEVRISPVIITRTLGRMIEKELIQFHANDNTYSVK